MSKPLNIFIGEYQKKIPVPILSLADSLDIKIIVENSIEHGIISYIKRNPETNGYEIFIRDNISTEKKRFAIAHEIAHYLKHKDILDMTGMLMNSRYNSNRFITLDKKDIEVHANRIATSILIPEKEFKQISTTGVRVVEMAKMFNVEKDVILARAAQLLTPTQIMQIL